MEIPNSVRYFRRLNEMVKELASEMKGEKMADFIDKQATINAVGLTTDVINFNPTKYVDAQGNELVAVVRCKDCKFYAEDEKWCKRLNLIGSFNENDFCSHGELDV